ncbi:MAG TPA: hypothetical protein VGM02_17600 [Acidobacteriaceae bacterium]|jgi:hypothetical protein
MAMTEVEFAVPPACSLRGAAALIEKACRECGLRVSTRATLQSYPGCIHWHVKRGIQPGTLELTLWEAKRRVWASVQDGRRAAWIVEALPQVKDAVETALRIAVS